MMGKRVRISLYGLLLLSLQGGGIAQPPPETPPPAAYVKPLPGAKTFTLSHIEGQAVFAPVGAIREAQTVGGLTLSLFREKEETPISTVRTDQKGLFQLEDVAPGRYVLAASLGAMHAIGIPLLVRADMGKKESPRLLLHLRLKEDPRSSFVTPVTRPALRKELIAMTAEDQDIRNEMIRKGADHPDPAVMARMTAIDARNLARMREIVKQYGFPGPDLVGMDGTEAGFLLIQHATPDFQQEMLPQVRKAYQAGRLSGQSYALLQDRVLVRQGKPQVYGTQAKPFSDWKGGEPALYPIEDEANVDKRRAEMGLPTLAEYLQILKRMYFPQK